MAKFDLKGLLNDRSVPDRQQDQKIVYRNPEDLIPSEDNFYNTEKLELLKQSIELLGILQPLLIENRDGERLCNSRPLSPEVLYRPDSGRKR